MSPILFFIIFFTCTGVGKIFLQINSAAVAFVDILIAAWKGLTLLSKIFQYMYHKTPKNSNTRKIAVLILNFTQCGSTIVSCAQKMQTELKTVMTLIRLLLCLPRPVHPNTWDHHSIQVMFYNTMFIKCLDVLCHWRHWHNSPDAKWTITPPLIKIQDKQRLFSVHFTWDQKHVYLFVLGFLSIFMSFWLGSQTKPIFTSFY